VAEDRLLQAMELRPGLHADLVDELLPRAAVRFQCLGLAPATVEGEHQLPDQPLAGRMGGQELLQLSEQLGVVAAGEVGVHACLQRGEPLLLQSRDLRLREGLVRHILQRRPAPQAQRAA
jgi:hypothetical protein